jgi:enamine deaminase RidA (YjgF/YER057c/UK114 family)
MTRFELVNPAELGRHSGFSHGVVAPAGGRVLFVAGQTAPRAGGFVPQFAAALARALAVVREAGGEPEHVARMTIYVTDMAIYRAERPHLGEAWRTAMGTHYPAMALVEVRSLVDPGAVVEIEATAVLPPAERS